VDGIPVFAELRDDAHKQEQADQRYDPASEDWEIERPWTGPSLYGWLMLEKMRRSLIGIEHLVPGSVALVVCAGSGMDAELLARRGAKVIASDISIDAALRTRERARRHGVPLVPLVADAEALPFRDRGVDITYVHDGLHHLLNPDLGLHEMARVAGRAMSVSEPASALVTRLAIQVGLALEEEPAGNRVERLEIARVMGVMHSAGLRVVGAERYPMFYRHEPGVLMRLLSRSRMAGPARKVVSYGAGLIGRASNKLAVRAVRDPEESPTPPR
jgi:SAM-dependent methyltransferase